MKNYLSGFILFLLILIIQNSVIAIGVQPLTFDFEMSPGETEEFSIILSTSGIEENVNISIYQSFQEYTGNLSYRKGDLESFPQLNWIKLENDRVAVLREGEVQLKGSITVPFGTPGGSYTIILMIEPEATNPDQGVALLVRYAVRIIVRVDGPGLREQGEIKFVELQKDENGKQLVAVMVKNTSQLDYPGKVEVTIRDEERRLLERLTLKTISAQKINRDIIRIYPGTELLFIGWPEHYLYPDNYEVRAFFEYGERGRKTMSNYITIPPGLFIEPEPDASNYYNLKPARITSFLEPGKRENVPVQISNISNKSFYLTTEVYGVEPEYQYSLLPWMKFSNGGEGIRLEPRQLSRSLNIIQLPLDITSGGYYALLNIKAYTDETMVKLLDEKIVPIICFVGSEHNIETELTEFKVDKESSDFRFRLTIRNTGNRHIEPMINISLFDKEENTIKKIELKSNDLFDKLLLPAKEANYEGSLGNCPEKGIYTAVIEVFHEKNSVEKFTYNVEVK